MIHYVFRDLYLRTFLFDIPKDTLKAEILCSRSSCSVNVGTYNIFILVAGQNLFFDTLEWLSVYAHVINCIVVVTIDLFHQKWVSSGG